MQEHRKLAPDGPITGLLQLFGRGADHHPVALGSRKAEQLVPDRASNQIHLHDSAC